ncbi:MULTISPECIES: PD-(D/E)XK nuclease family protein [Cyanophyceae]|uniref:PD-(D/E)XK nuclease family protein n=1 Tax=Cyanophyceae TaxID=3028117 RepID=UPI001683D1CC|nr:MULTISPECIES: PD-(D/E)XK nuclease family protein [Cyanophyceae]MBD1916267.1 PD-(D/E)XK nuclease family protein [Phormidium sp. FACHB-77]MBD2028393.1 PD-(D/E)XK nuclease family protein [Phormidium sp. FACHB-322]MBD2051872.1 PD-(D/E)XK nuclease family protein [Leptolyngbya sp. FACHB-60]
MARFVLTHSNSYATALEWSKRPGSQLVTPSRLAARALHAQHQALRQLAIKAVESGGKKIAPDRTAQRLFRQVVQDLAQPVDGLGTARAWMPGVRSLLQSSPNLSTVTATSPRIAQLLDVAKAYQTALSEQGFIDGADLYWQAAESKVPPQQLLIYGYFQPRPDELAWINALAADESVLFLPIAESPLFADSQTSVDWLVEQGWQVTGELDTRSQSSNGGENVDAKSEQNPGNFALGESLSQVFCGARDRVSSGELGQGQQNGTQKPGLSGATTSYAYSTLEAEVRGTLAQVKALLNDGTLARDIAIVARDEVAYGPKLIDIAWEYGVPLRALYQTPLLSTRLGTWLNLLVDVLDAKFPFEGTARLLSHVLASNPDRDFWATARRQYPQDFAAWKALAQDHLDLDLDLLAQINQARRRDTWVELWQSILGRFDLRRRCARWARESVAFNRFRDALRELAEPEAEILNWGEFRQELRDLLDSLTVPAQPGRGGVELHSPRSVVGARYTHLFVIGMAEGVLPAPIGNDPLLDFFERQQLRQQKVMLPSAAEMARREALNVYFLLQTVTTAVVFSYPQLEGRKELLPSPYLAQLGLKPSEPPVPAIASPEEHRRTVLRHSSQTEDPVLLAAVHAYAVEQGRESSAAANEYDGVIGIPFDYGNWPFSVSQLRNLGQCPFNWFANKLLKLGPPEETDDDLNPSQIGQLYHRVLELVLAAWGEHPELEVADPGMLHAAFAIAERELISPTLPAWTLRREEHLRILALALQDPNFLPTGAEPVLLEGDFEGEWHGLKVRGRIDRIDRTEAGLVLIDYKTGKSRPLGIKDQTGKACIDLQLPLYREAAGPARFDELIADAYYYSIRGREKIALSSKAPQHELPAAIERCKIHLETGHYPVQPDTERKACTYCDFDALCRQGDRLSRKEITHGTD